MQWRGVTVYLRVVMLEKVHHVYASPKVAERIARRMGQKTQVVTVKMIGEKDVNKLITGIFEAEKSSRKMTMALD